MARAPFIICVVAAGGLSLPLQAASPKAASADVPALVSRLSSPRDAPEAAHQLSAAGQAAIGPLTELARADGDLLARGWAIVVLSDTDADAAGQALLDLAQQEPQPALVRTWANAARLRRASTLEDLLSLAPLLDNAPALEAAFTARALTLANNGAASKATRDDHAQVGRLLAAGIERPALQRALFPVIRILGAKPLVGALLYERPAVRRVAAAHLASLARRGGGDDVKAALLQGLRFAPKASAPPWSGGPLLLPALFLDDDGGKALFATLLRWYVWAEQRGDAVHGRPLHDVLRAVAGGALPGATLPGWYARSSLEWLRAWRQTAGADELRALLDEQGLAGDDRYRPLLTETP